MKKALLLVGCLALVGRSATAQQEAANDPGAAMRRSFGEVGGWVTKAADLVPADKYSYKPTATVRTFGQLIAHVADGLNWYCGNATGKNVDWSDAVEKGPTDKAALAPKLKAAIDGCNAVYASGGKFSHLVANIGHTNLHYGNAITYLRMMGLVPPSS